MAKYYIDTCIWIDYWENRSDKLRPIGQFALDFFNHLNDEDIIYYSKLSIKELRKRYSDDIIKSIFGIVRENMSLISIMDDDICNAKRFISTGLAHDADAIHISLARRMDAILVTRDKEILVSGLVKAYRPEELI